MRHMKVTQNNLQRSYRSFYLKSINKTCFSTNIKDVFLKSHQYFLNLIDFNIETELVLQ